MEITSKNLGQLTKRLLCVTLSLGTLLVAVSCGGNKKISGGQQLPNPTKIDQKNSNIAPTEASQISLAPNAGNWAQQDVLPLPPRAIQNAYGRVLQTKPTLSDKERFRLGEVQMEFVQQRDVRLTPMRGLPDLSYLQTIREVAYRSCKTQLDAERSGAAAPLWLNEAKDFNEAALSNIYASLVGLHTSTPAMKNRAKAALDVFRAAEKNPDLKETAAVKQNMLCLYVLTDSIVILR